MYTSVFFSYTATLHISIFHKHSLFECVCHVAFQRNDSYDCTAADAWYYMFNVIHIVFYTLLLFPTRAKTKLYAVVGNKSSVHGITFNQHMTCNFIIYLLGLQSVCFMSLSIKLVGLLMKTRGYSPCVERLCAELDSQLLVLLQDLQHYLQKSDDTLDRKEVQQHLQTCSMDSIQQ